MFSLKPLKIRLALGMVGMILSQSASADAISDLEALSLKTDSLERGLLFAREQTERGQLLDALSAIERVLLNFPDSDEAKLQHASLLCRLDDRSGSLVEFDALRGHNFDPTVWSEATKPCNNRKTGS
jgi:hypothetical protein